MLINWNVRRNYKWTTSFGLAFPYSSPGWENVRHVLGVGFWEPFLSQSRSAASCCLWVGLHKRNQSVEWWMAFRGAELRCDFLLELSSWLTPLSFFWRGFNSLFSPSKSTSNENDLISCRFYVPFIDNYTLLGTFSARGVFHRRCNALLWLMGKS